MKQKSVDIPHLQSVTNEIYNKANIEFKQYFPDIEFSEAEITLPHLKLAKTQTYEEKHHELMQSAKTFKKCIEDHKKETAVIRTYGTELSLRKRNMIRITEYFETSESCYERTMKEKEKILSGTKKNKVHIPTNIRPWNQERCIDIVKSYPANHKINFTDLGRECGLIVDGYPRNGGQIVKCFLEENGINTENFDYHSKSITNTRLRRGKRKIDGTTVSIPADITNEQLK